MSRATRSCRGKGKPQRASYVQGSPVAEHYRPPVTATGPERTNYLVTSASEAKSSFGGVFCLEKQCKLWLCVQGFSAGVSSCECSIFHDSASRVMQAPQTASMMMSCSFPERNCSFFSRKKGQSASEACRCLHGSFYPDRLLRAEEENRLSDELLGQAVLLWGDCAENQASTRCCAAVSDLAVR